MSETHIGKPMLDGCYAALRSAVADRVKRETGGMPAIDPEVLARAEMAVAALGIEFVDRIKNELSENRTHVEHAGDDPAALDIKQIFTFAHDMRGQGGSFGYPLISEIGGSLCHFIESRDHSFQADDITVLRAHLDAANAIISSAMSGEGDTVSRALIDSLDALVRKQLTGQF